MAKDAHGSPFDIRAAVFDLDGLLVNTEELYQDVGTELLRRRGKTFDADLLDAMMGRPQDKALSIMIDWHGLDDTVENLADETKTIFQTVCSRCTFSCWSHPPLSLYPDVCRCHCRKA